MYDGGEHNPKLLPCSHTVCLQCLDRIVATFARDTGQFRCPICRELITIPRGGVQALPPSFLVNQLLDLMARQRREVIPKCSTHHNQVKQTNTRQVSSMIHSARSTVTPVANIVFCCFVFLDLKSGDGRTDNYPYWPWLWVGRVDQYFWY